MFFFCICFFSCSSLSDQRSSRVSIESLSPISVSSDSPVIHQPVPRFKTLDTVLSFAGVWVNENYFDSIGKNRSPRLDQGIEKSCIVIPKRTLMETNMVGGFHDGGSAMVVIKNGNKYQFYDPELKFPRDTIEPISSTRLRIGNQYFQPLNHPDSGKNDWGILEEILFSGKYKMEDGSKVEFLTDGHVNGLGAISYYEPVIDYSDRGDRQLDRISLGKSHKNLAEYGFRFDKDTLLIYVVDCLKYDVDEHACDSAKFGELMWKLRRIHK